MDDAKPVYCSFCGKSNHETEVMLAGMANFAFICEECVTDAKLQIQRKKHDDAMMRDVVRCAFCMPAPIANEVRHG